MERKSTIHKNISDITSLKVGKSISSGKNEPAHYMLKVESFSMLSQAGIDKFESDVFEAGGYKWRLILYPDGNKKENGEDYISLYLAIVDTMSLSCSWEVHVYFKIFIYDHIRGDYLTIQDANGERRRFHEKKTEWGFARLLSQDLFKDISSGFLFQDSCVFGVEVFVVPKYAQKEQCFSISKPPETNRTYTWIIDNFSAVKDVKLCSEEFKVGKVKWKIVLYPLGNAAGKSTHLSLYLAVSDPSSFPVNWRFYTKCMLRMKNQASSDDDQTNEFSCWFCDSTFDWGFSAFMSLTDVNDPKKHFIVNDCLIVEAEILFVGMIKDFI